MQDMFLARCDQQHVEEEKREEALHETSLWNADSPPDSDDLPDSQAVDQQLTPDIEVQNPLS